MTFNNKYLVFLLSFIQFCFLQLQLFSDISRPTPISGTVNVITGEYSESSTDLTISGPKPLSIERYFFGINSGNPSDGLAWHFNHPGILSEEVSEVPNTIENAAYDYEYDSKNRLTKVEIKNVRGDKVFSSAHFVYSTEGEENVCEVTTSDGRQLFYFYKEGSVTRGTPGLTIGSMIDPLGNETQYTYRQHPNERKQLIQRVEDSQGGYLETEYYEGKHNNVGGKLVTVNDPIRDFRIGRIKLQKAPVGPDGSSVITQCFFYQEGSTDVILSNGQKTTYRYSDDQLLTTIDTYNEGSLHKRESFFWSDQVGDKQSKRLISKTLQDSSGKTVLCHTYEYDERGLLIKEKCYGAITGSSDIAIDLSELGIPINPMCEYAEWSYEYEQYGEGKKLSRLITKNEPNGKVTRYKYDGETSRLKAILIGDSEGIHIRQFNQYNEDGLLIETITDDGYSETMSNLSGATERYRAVYHLKTAQPAIGMPEQIEEYCYNLEIGEELPVKRTTYHYSDLNKVIQKDIYDANNNYSYSIYQNFDPLGRKTSQSENSGKETFWEYDANGNVVHEIIKGNDGSTHSTRKVYDKANRLIKVITLANAEDENVVSYRYNAMGHKITDIDSHGNETHYQYDQLGRLASVTYPAVVTENGNFDHPKESFEYDLFGHCTKKTDPNGYITRISYNVFGKPLQIIHPDNTKEEFEYYTDGSIKKKIDKLGISTIYHRDYQSRVIKEEKFSASGQLISSIKSMYNGFNLIKTIDHNGVETSYTYNAKGQKVEITRLDADGLHRVELEYDNYGNVAAKKEWFGDGPNDFSKLITVRDVANNVIETRLEDANGVILRQKFSDEAYQPKADQKKQKIYTKSFNGKFSYQEEVTNSKGITLNTSYDALGRANCVVKKNAQGTILSEVEMVYDLAGNKVKETHYAFTETETKQFTLSWKYGPERRLEGIVEAEGSREQRTTQYLYNANGQLETIIKPDRVSLTHDYDDLGNISRFYSSDGTVDYEYVYDHNGNICQVIDRTHNVISEKIHNESGMLLRETLANGLTLEYSYDKIGRRTSYSLPDNSKVQFHYDAANLLEVTRQDNKEQYQYHHSFNEYDLHGNMLTESLVRDCGNITYKYSLAGQITQTSSPWWTESLEWEKDHRGETSNLSRIVTNDLLGQVSSSFQYDSNSRLTKENGCVDNNYTYDPFGNRTSCNNEHMSYNSVNGLIYDGDYHYIYDTNGNLKEKVSEGEAFSFQYDALNRMTSVTIDEDQRILYIYDSQGRRIEKIIQEYSPEENWKSTEIVKYIFVDNNEIGQTNNEGTITHHRILNPSKRSDIGATIAIELNNELYAAINDARGNIACLVNANTAEVSEFYRYTAFGEETIINENLQIKPKEDTLSPWRYSSKRYELETELVFFGKRYYSPKIGRWITTDPLGYIDGINRYSYVQNNPLENIDHYGLLTFSELWNSMVSFFDNALNVVMDFGSKALSFIRMKTQYLQQIQPDITSTLEEYFGKGFLTLAGYYSHPLETGVYGQGEVSDNVRITLLNGISNIRSYYRDSLELLNSTHGGVNIHYIFRPTSGWCGDMIMALLIKCGYVSPYAKELAATWRQMIEEMGGVGGGGTIIHYCHSLGGTDTAVAGTLLTPEERQMIKIISFGSATMISNNYGFADVINFVSIRDGVCLLDPIGYIKGIMGVDVNIAFIGSFLGVPLVDHSLAMDTYTETITKLGHVFLQMYAYGGGLI